MRADDRQKLLKEIETTEEPQPTRSMYFRIGKSIYKTITELADISGANKSDIVRKLVTRGLTGKDIEIGKESQTVKLDWLVRESKRNKLDLDALRKDLKGVREVIGNIERSGSKNIEKADGESAEISRKLLAEIYCLLSAVFYSHQQVLSRLIQLTSKSFDEIQNSSDVASLEMARHLSVSLNDLDNLAKMHGLKIGRAFGDRNYGGVKAEIIQKHLAEKKKTGR